MDGRATLVLADLPHFSRHLVRSAHVVPSGWYAWLCAVMTPRHALDSAARIAVGLHRVPRYWLFTVHVAVMARSDKPNTLSRR